MIPTYIEYEIEAAGLTQAIDITKLVDEYRLFVSAPVTLAGDVTITPTGTPIEGCRTIFKYEGGVTLDGHDMTIYGRTITQAEALSACKIECNYNNSAWDVVLYYSDRIQQANIVTYNTWDGSGSTINLNPVTDSKNQVYTATAPISLTGSYVVQVDPTYTPVEGDEFIVKYECLATLNANTITIFGQNIPSVQALGGNVEVRTIYDAATAQWMTSHRVLFDNNMYRVLGSSGDTSPAYLDSKVGKSVVVASNKIELDGDALTPGNNYYYGTNGSGTKGFFPIAAGTILQNTVQIDHADILTLNSVPIELVSSPGAGKAIDVIHTTYSIYGALGVVTPYATFMVLNIITDTAAVAQEFDNKILKSTINRTLNTNTLPSVSTTSDTKIIANKGLYLQTDINPTGGAVGQYLVINVMYRIIDI